MHFKIEFTGSLQIYRETASAPLKVLELKV